MSRTSVPSTHCLLNVVPAIASAVTPSSPSAAAVAGSSPCSRDDRGGEGFLQRCLSSGSGRSESDILLDLAIYLHADTFRLRVKPHSASSKQ